MTTPIDRPGCWPSWFCCCNPATPKEQEIQASPAGEYENGKFHPGGVPKVTEAFKKEFEGK